MESIHYPYSSGIPGRSMTKFPWSILVGIPYKCYLFDKNKEYEFSR